MHAVQDLLRSFFLNIKASYPWREWTFTSPPQNSVEDCLKRLQEISASRSSALLGLSDRAAIVVIPTGAGKSLLMLLTPFAILDPATHSTRYSAGVFQVQLSETPHFDPWIPGMLNFYRFMMLFGAGSAGEAKPPSLINLVLQACVIYLPQHI